MKEIITNNILFKNRDRLEILIAKKSIPFLDISSSYIKKIRFHAVERNCNHDTSDNNQREMFTRPMKINRALTNLG